MWGRKKQKWVLCHSQCCAKSHTSATQFLLSVFLKRGGSSHHRHRQKTWIMTPASWGSVILYEVMVAKWACGPLLIFKLFKVPCKTPSKCLKTIVIHAVFFSFWLWQPHATFCTDAWGNIENYGCHHDRPQLCSHDRNRSKLHPGTTEIFVSHRIGVSSPYSGFPQTTIPLKQKSLQKQLHSHDYPPITVFTPSAALTSPLTFIFFLTWIHRETFSILPKA